MHGAQCGRILQGRTRGDEHQTMLPPKMAAMDEPVSLTAARSLYGKEW